MGDNGAFYFRYDHHARRMVRRFADDPERRAENRLRLEDVGRAVLAAMPNAAIAADQPYRETDLATDVAEDAAPLLRPTSGRPSAGMARAHSDGLPRRIFPAPCPILDILGQVS